MNSPEETIREKLLGALQESDKLHRVARAERIEWLSLHSPETQVLAGRAETLQLLEEVKLTFINGHFVAALIVAMAFIEHTLVEELQFLGLITGSPPFSQALKAAADNKVFPPDWVIRARDLSWRRNSFVHLKVGDEHGLGARILNEQRHPLAIMEDDAKNAVDLMFNFFIATVREGKLEA